MQMPPHKYLEISTEGKILIISINNPPNNYLPGAIFSEFDSCLELMESSDVKAVVFTGKGKVFSKGADINELSGNQRRVDHGTISHGNKIVTSISRLTKPVIAAINGPCFGAGLELALACHIRLCSEKARLGLPELSIGVIPGLGGIERLIRVVGEAKALEMILLGDMVSAARSLEMNLVNRVLPKKDFLPKVLVFVKTILAAGTGSIEEVLRLFALSRPEHEERNIAEAAKGFIRLVSSRKTLFS